MMSIITVAKLKHLKTNPFRQEPIPSKKIRGDYLIVFPANCLKCLKIHELYNNIELADPEIHSKTKK